MARNILVVANNASSPQKLIDVAKVVFNFEYSEIVSALIVTKPVGSAAQVGIPEVSKLAYKLGKTLVILPSVNDAIELFKPTKVLLLCRTNETQPIETIDIPDNSMIVTSCSDVGFTKGELALGIHTYPKHFNYGIGPAAEIVLSLYALASKVYQQ